MSKKKVAKAILPPYKAQNYYEKELIKLIDKMEKKLFKKFNLLKDNDTQEGILSFILNFLDNKIVNKIAKKFVNLINTINEKKYKKGLENIGLSEIVTPNIEDLLESHRATNISLIKSIPQKMHSKLEIKLKEAFENGENIEDILRKEFDISRSRAKLIARDQTAKINHSLTLVRAKANGSTKYKWRTSKDERVRTTHQELEGKIFEWGIGSTCCGDPSDDVNCRCSARAIYS